MIGSHRDSRYRIGGPMDDVAENIRNEQRGEGIDRNPSLRCDGCDRMYHWKHFKNHGQASANPEVPLLCSLCNAGITPETREKRVERKKEENQSLDGFEVESDG